MENYFSEKYTLDLIKHFIDFIGKTQFVGKSANNIIDMLLDYLPRDTSYEDEIVEKFIYKYISEHDAVEYLADLNNIQHISFDSFDKAEYIAGPRLWLGISMYYRMINLLLEANSDTINKLVSYINK